MPGTKIAVAHSLRTIVRARSSDYKSRFAQIQEVRARYGHSPKGKWIIAALSSQPAKQRKAVVATVDEIEAELKWPFRSKGRFRPLKTKRAIGPMGTTALVSQQEHRIREMLATIVSPEEISRWMRAANVQLDNMTPERAIAAGQGDKVIELIHRVQEGIYV